MDFLDREPSATDYTIRIHPRDTPIDFAHLEGALLFNSDRYVITKEKEDHFHLVVFNIKLDPFIKQLKDKFPQFKGNKYYSATKVKDVRKALKYACKDLKEYKYKGFEEDDIQYIHRISHKKYEAEIYSKEYNKILDDNITNANRCFVALCMLYKRYKKNINFNVIKSIVVSNCFEEDDFIRVSENMFNYY